LLIVLLGLAGAAGLAADAAGLRAGGLLLVGAGLGFALRQTGFGFAGAWRAQVIEGRGAGLRAQLALLALLTVVFFPLFAAGGVLGQPVADVVRPVGIALLAGAFLFGIGAQLALACSSGSLAALGNGTLRYVIVITAMVAGATLGSAHFGWWEAQTSWFSFSFFRSWGPVGGIAGNLTLLLGIFGLSVWIERRRHGAAPLVQPRRTERPPWPMAGGLVVLAILCVLTLVLAGRPWTIMTAPPLWGAKFIETFSLPFDVGFWDYWAATTRIDALSASLWTDITTLMIVGLVLGTALASALSGRLALQWRIRPGEAFTALLGGLLLGYGGVVGLGCNIGAFLGGVSSGSLHGWVWLGAAFAGTAAGVGIKALPALIRRQVGPPPAAELDGARHG
jgi:uncharacterized membrane protein YedE/YeeE